MQIAIIGAGKVGATLGSRWQAGGHDVTYGVRDPLEARHAELGGSVALPADAVQGADVVLVALPWASAGEVLATVEVGDAVVVDATNPLAPGTRELLAHPELSGAQQVAAWTGSARVVKAFNTTGSANMADPTYAGAKLAMVMAGDDEAAKEVVAALATELGFDPIDGGPLSAAIDLEHLAALWIRLAYPLGHGPGIAWALLRR